MRWPFVIRRMPQARWGLSLCALCDQAQSSLLCQACLNRFGFPSAHHACPRCAEPVAGSNVTLCGDCIQHPPAFARTLAALPYGFPWDGIIQGFKFNARLDWLSACGDVLNQRIGDELRSCADLKPDVIMPMPLSMARWRSRGYNQAARLAAPISRALGLPLEERCLLKLRDTPHQTRLDRQARSANLRNSFWLDTRRPKPIGLHVALVDDVMTTGATAHEAAKTLLQSGAREVSIWVLARTPRHDGA